MEFFNRQELKFLYSCLSRLENPSPLLDSILRKIENNLFADCSIDEIEEMVKNL